MFLALDESVGIIQGLMLQKMRAAHIYVLSRGSLQHRPFSSDCFVKYQSRKQLVIQLDVVSL